MSKQHRHHSSRRRSGFYRLLRYRFMLPLLRSHHPPAFAARGTAVGLALAFTPTIGLHTLIAGALWAATARAPKLHFSLILALAWTWASNPLTAFPIYYLLYVTGQIMFGHWSNLSGYEDFLTLARDLQEGDRTLLQNAELLVRILLDEKCPQSLTIDLTKPDGTAVRLLDAAQMKFEGGYVLEGTPKEATPAYQKVLLYVDGQTSQVRRVLILDAQGNRNRFDFSAPVVNQAVEKSEFDFTPPPGTRIIKP